MKTENEVLNRNAATVATVLRHAEALSRGLGFPLSRGLGVFFIRSLRRTGSVTSVPSRVTLAARLVSLSRRAATLSRSVAALIQSCATDRLPHRPGKAAMLALHSILGTHSGRRGAGKARRSADNHRPAPPPLFGILPRSV